MQALLAATEVGDVWGVGLKIGAQLRAQGIHTALQLQCMDPAAAKAGWSVVLEKTVRQLNGEPCIEFEHEPPAKQQIACTRSFGHRLMTAMEQLNQRCGRGTLKLASAGAPRAHKIWPMRREMKSAGFTTDWTELAVAF